MAPSDKHHREHCSTTERPAPDREESAFDCAALLLEGEREAEVPYYVEVAGDYSIPHATAERWGSGDDSARRRNSARQALRRKGF